MEERLLNFAGTVEARWIRELYFVLHTGYL